MGAKRPVNEKNGFIKQKKFMKKPYSMPKIILPYLGLSIAVTLNLSYILKSWFIPQLFSYRLAFPFLSIQIQ